MFISIAGVLLAILGLVTGIVLVGQPLGLLATNGTMMLWVLFPLFTTVGYVMLVVGARTSQLAMPSRVLAGLMLLLALAAAAGLTLDATGVRSVGTGAASLWYVLVGAGLLGSIGAASFRRASADD